MPTVQPTTNRILSLDVLRGFALLGILIMNIISFAMPGAHYLNPMAGGPLVGADKWAFMFSHLLADQKFMSLFAMLFGAGVVLMTQKIERKGNSAVGRHYTRNFWLLVIGLFHAHIIWYGDILVQYALCSIWVFLFRKKTPKTLLIWAGIFLAIGFLGNLFFGLSLPYWSAEEVTSLCNSWQPSAEKLAAETAAYRGNWSDHFPLRQESAIALETFLFVADLMWQVTALMLIGMVLFKTNILTAERSRAFYQKMALIGLGLGLPLGILGLVQNYAHNWACDYSFFLGSQFNFVGSLPMALGYIGLVMLWYKGSGQRFLQQWLAPVGQMALTNYLLQSIIATLLFYGHGLGLYGTIGRANLWLFVLGIWVFQLLFSKWWLQSFKFGPFEWFWRCLTYWEVQDFRK